MNDLTRRYLPRFIEVAHERLGNVLEALGTPFETAELIAGELHTLAGEAGLLGLSTISTLSREGEAAARQMNPGENKALVTCTRVTRSIRRELMALVEEFRASAPAPKPDRRTVLVVDDSEIVASQIADALEDASFAATIAASGEAATDLARSTSPNVILVDVHMDDCTVEQLCPELREICPRAEILLVSGMAPSELEALSKKVGATGFVCKQAGLLAIVATVQNLPNGARG